MREVVGGNPWKSVGERFPEGEIVNGTVERLTNFGVFIELEPGLTGLLPFAAIPGIANPRRKFHPGKEVPVRILSIDTGRKRISLGTENSKAEGSPQDYREYQKSQSKGQRGGMNALAAAFAKLKDEAQVDDQQ
jgi:small subunit ribosomal protein S1